ncbi:hypothetical protein MN032_16600 [Agromyces atrinae]|uniref:hypothetical protein n=1 Tax=Agromyces atrinae TaxID=592376 RepID=UPI001F58C8FC|nr:hypothetical protein [Agromyces atrinae]MCI2959309.1 hypothetical protein [Agromyces atrinae]
MTGVSVTESNRDELARRRARWGVALVASSIVALGGVWFGGGLIAGTGVRGVIGAIVLIAIGVAYVAGIVILLRASWTTNRVARIGMMVVVSGTLIAGVGGVVLFALVDSRDLAGLIVTLPLGILICTGGAMTVLIGWLLRPPAEPRARPVDTLPSPRARRWAGIAVTAGLAVVIAFGLYDALVLSPQAMAPDYTLAEIYALLDPAERAGGIVMIVVWAAFWSIVTLLVLAVALVPWTGGVGRWLTPNRLVVFGLALASVVIFFQGWSTFSLGNTISDTVPPMVGTRSWQAEVYWFAGTAFMIVAIVRALVPGPRLRPEADASSRAGREPSRAEPP